MKEVHLLKEQAWRLWSALFTGIPFGIFKMGAGYYCILHGHFVSVGIALLFLGVIDTVLNVAACFRPHPFPYCLISLVGSAMDRRCKPRKLDLADVGLALDTLLAFSIVSLMIWNSCLPAITPVFGRSWDLAVIFNILGVGLARVAESLGLGNQSIETANA